MVSGAGEAVEAHTADVGLVTRSVVTDVVTSAAVSLATGTGSARAASEAEQRQDDSRWKQLRVLLFKEAYRKLSLKK